MLFDTLTDSASPTELAANWERVAANWDLLLDRPEAVEALEKCLIELALKGEFRHMRSLGASDAAEPESDADVQPARWPMVRFGDVLEELRYGTAAKCAYDTLGAPVLRIPNLQGGRIDVTDLKYGMLDERERSVLSLRRDDLLIVRSNGSASLVGTIAVVDDVAEGFAYAGYLVRARPKPDRINPRYMLLVSLSREFRRQIEVPIRTTSGVKNINSTEISSLTFTLPPLKEQRRIVALVDQLRRFCADLRDKLAAARGVQGWLAAALIQQTDQGHV